MTTQEPTIDGPARPAFPVFMALFSPLHAAVLQRLISSQSCACCSAEQVLARTVARVRYQADSGSQEAADYLTIHQVLQANADAALSYCECLLVWRKL